MAEHRLSKSRFQTGLQCSKALWLAVHEPQRADPVSPSQQRIFDRGTSLGDLARRLYPAGVLVAESHLQRAKALETTARLVTGDAPALFEAAFEHGGVLVRADILVRVGPGEWDLYEVKSATSVKDQYLTDVAIQTWVLEGCGQKIRRACVVHIDSSYVWPGGSYDLAKLFAVKDVTETVRVLLPTLTSQVSAFQTMLAGPLPVVAIGRRCDTPYSCSFKGFCHRHVPSPSVFDLSRLKEATLDRLIASGLLALREVPLDTPGLLPAHREVLELVRSGQPRIVGDIAGALAGLPGPYHFLDFETAGPGLPLFPGTRPYQAVPFQWSNHVRQADGTLEHREFLHEARTDPREPFLASLLAATADAGTVVVYSSYEQTQLTALAAQFPHHAMAIEALKGKLFDLEKVVRAHLRHPACLGRTSIKVVLPALVPDLSYEALAIGDGQQAAALYEQFLTGQLDLLGQASLFDDLRTYCGTDTMAMVRLWDVLRDGAF